MTADRELCRNVVELLLEQGLTLATAESMTGGMLAKLITDLPGTSRVFDRGIVTYSNESKISELDVKPETIEKYGAISEETAIEMAEGLRIYSGCSVCVSVTGNAGPDPAENKEVGVYYAAVCYNGTTEVYRLVSMETGRDEIRIDACNHLLRIIYNIIN